MRFFSEIILTICVTSRMRTLPFFIEVGLAGGLRNAGMTFHMWSW